MSNPKAATTTSKGRTYGLELPEPAGHVSLWSVTTMIGGGAPKPALLPWGIKATAEYAVANYRRLFAMCQAAEGDEEAIYQVVAWLKGAPYRERKAKANLGSLFHRVAEAHALRAPVVYTDEERSMQGELAPLVVQFERFLADWRPDIEMAEATVYNLRESYAGTLDAIAVMGGRRLLVDYKTGKDVYSEVALQLAAYARAEGVYLAPGQVAPMPAVDGAVVVHVTADGYRVIPIEIGDPVFRSFAFVREVFRWMEEISKAVLGDALPPPARPKRTRKAAA